MLDGLQLAWRRDLQQLDRRRASEALRNLAEAPGGLADLRDQLRHALGAAAEQLSEEALVEAVCAYIASGSLIAFQRRRKPGTWTERVVMEETPPAEPVLAATPEMTWVEFQLVDEEGDPVPGERYRVTLPDGTVREGKLNYRGRVRFDHIAEPGSCTIAFPDLDSDAWEAI